ncbi:unnamed protein product [Caenorhabditis bovis]|uniref:Nuclear transport factor 2 family protein n=1 Tax=Caenorhabditis bovis TaxID=2654633 RepID=A0A8S1FDP8_9PELO|nr:unnamed protein product [Caenorhabditis bovis]
MNILFVASIVFASFMVTVVAERAPCEVALEQLADFVNSGNFEKAIGLFAANAHARFCDDEVSIDGIREVLKESVTGLYHLTTLPLDIDPSGQNLTYKGVDIYNNDDIKYYYGDLRVRVNDELKLEIIEMHESCPYDVKEYLRKNNVNPV